MIATHLVTDTDLFAVILPIIAALVALGVAIARLYSRVSALDERTKKGPHSEE